MEPIRRNALMQAAISEIGSAGSLDVTVSQIAKRAGMSTALAHHYFGNKEHIFSATMRHILTLYGTQVRAALRDAITPRARLEAIIRTSFDSENFRTEVISAWMNLYVKSRTSPETRQLLNIYQKRLHSNLLHDLRHLSAERANFIATTIAALIDGYYIRHALTDCAPNGNAAANNIIAVLDQMLTIIVPQISPPEA